MATISYVVNAINNASKTFDAVAGSAAAMGASIDAAQEKIDTLNGALAATDLAANAASAGLEGLARQAFATAAAQSALAAATDAQAAKLAETGLAARAAGAGFGLWAALAGAASAKVVLFGGVLGNFMPGLVSWVHGWHIMIDAVFEFIAVLAPALVALTAFGVPAAAVLYDMSQSVENMNTIAAATGQKIGILTGGLTKMYMAVQPQVYQLLGDYLTLIANKAGYFQQVAVATGKVLDNLGARFVLAAESSGALNKTLATGPHAVQEFGNIFGNIGSAIGGFIKAVPGYAIILLSFVSGLTKVIAVVINGITPVLNLALAIHGAVLWIGLFVTAAAFLVRGLIAVGRWAFGGVVAMLAWARAAIAAAGATGIWDSALAIMDAVNPMAWVVIATAAVIALVAWISRAKDATQTWLASWQSSIMNAQTISQGMTEIVAAQAATTIRLAGAQRGLADSTDKATVAGQKYNTAAAGFFKQTADVQALQSGLSQQNSEYATQNTRIAALSKTYGGTAQAMGLLYAAGISEQQLIAKGPAAWALLRQQVAATYTAFKEMGVQTGVLGADLKVLDSVNFDTYESMQKINSAWSTWIGDVTGGQQAFDTYDQGLTALMQKGETFHVDLGKLSDALKYTGGRMDGLSASSIALNQAFSTQVGNVNDLIAQWRTAGIVGASFSEGVKDSIAPLLRYAAGSKEAAAQLVALAQEANYTGPETLAGLVKWLGNTANATRNVKDVTDQATIQEALLTNGMQEQGSYITSQLIGDINQAILAYNGVQQAAKAYGKAVAEDGQQSQAAHNARTVLINDLIASGKAAHDTTGQIAAMISKVLGIPLKRTLQIVVDASGSYRITAESGGRGRRGPSLPSPAAAGMMVRGGTPGMDSVLISAMPGEVVVPTHLVRAGAVNHLRGAIPGFAQGGVVGSYGGSNPSGLGSWTVNQYGDTLIAIASATAAAAAAAMRAAQSAATSVGGGGGYGGGAGPGGGAPAANAALARRMFPSENFAAWNYVAMAESGWNQFALNPGSGAYGIPQALPPTKMPFAAQAAGGSNPAAQISWMAAYMNAAYGGAAGAAAHERAFHSYGGGGIISEPVLGIGASGAMYGLGESGPEAVVPLSGAGGSGAPDIAGYLSDIAGLLEELCGYASSAPAQTAAGMQKALAGRGRTVAYRRLYGSQG